jgi:hypothetical protein
MRLFNSCSRGYHQARSEFTTPPVVSCPLDVIPLIYPLVLSVFLQPPPLKIPVQFQRFLFLAVILYRVSLQRGAAKPVLVLMVYNVYIL